MNKLPSPPSAPQKATLSDVLKIIGGHHVSGTRKYQKWLNWLLKKRVVVDCGLHGVVYRVQLSDASIAIKVGVIEEEEALIQRYAASIGYGLPVYGYYANSTLHWTVESEICLRHGPDWRREKAGLVSEDKDTLFCWCEYPKDVLIMPLAETVPASQISESDKQALCTAAAHIEDVARRKWRYVSEIRTIMKYHGRLVFVDFGDAIALERMFDPDGEGDLLLDNLGKTFLQFQKDSGASDVELWASKVALAMMGDRTEARKRKRNNHAN